MKLEQALADYGLKPVGPALDPLHQLVLEYSQPDQLMHTLSQVDLVEARSIYLDHEQAGRPPTTGARLTDEQAAEILQHALTVGAITERELLAAVAELQDTRPSTDRP